MHIDIKRQMLSDPLFLSGITLGLIFLAISSLAPVLSPYDPWDMSFEPISSPCFRHILGVNDGGQDIFSELLFALRNTMIFGLVSGMAALIIGVLAGASAGWFGGLADSLIMRTADVLLAIPAVMVLILIAALMRPSPMVLALLLSLLMWPTIAKAIRSQVLSIKNSLHVRAARQMGGGNWYIITRHLLPELYPLYLIGFSAKARMAFFMEASLAFLGLFDPSRKSLGMMISYSIKFYYMDIWWNWIFPPILCLSLIIMTATFLSISLEKILDPRLRSPILERSR